MAQFCPVSKRFTPGINAFCRVCQYGYLNSAVCSRWEDGVQGWMDRDCLTPRNPAPQLRDRWLDISRAACNFKFEYHHW